MSTAGDILSQLMATSPDLAQQAHRLLAPVVDARERLRERLLSDGRIIEYTASSGTVPASLAAVDGACVREHLYAADLLIATATSAKGMRSTDLPLATEEWAAIVPHEPENDRLLSAAMASLELRVLGAVEHELRILDGSYATPLLAVLMGLHANSHAIRDRVACLVDDTLLETVRAVTNDQQVVALPKSDTAHVYSDDFARRYGETIPGGDKFLATQILEPGEMLYPLPARHLIRTPRNAHREATGPVEVAVDRLNEAMSGVSASAAAGTTLVTYLKPTSTETVLKMEYRSHDPLSTGVDPTQGAVTEGARLARILAAETPGPHLQEPYAQHAVDLAAKTVSTATNAVRRALLDHLPDGSDGYRNLLIRGYRT